MTPHIRIKCAHEGQLANIKHGLSWCSTGAVGCMDFKYKLTKDLAKQASELEEFANGGAQCHAELNDGSVHAGLLISGATAIVAMRGHTSLPFTVEAIERLFQVEEDRNPLERGGWAYFDLWSRDKSA